MELNVASMQRDDDNFYRLWELVELGISLRRMQRATEKWPIVEGEDTPTDEPLAGQCISQFRQLTDKILLSSPEGRLKKILDDLDKLINSWNDSGLDKVNGDVRKLRNIARQLELLLSNILDQYIAFVPKELGVDARKYIIEIETYIGAEVFGQLPDKAIKDWQQAGKCLAFESYTAAVCLMVRATEAALRCYYCALTNEEVPGEGMWGVIIKRLKEKSDRKELSIAPDAVQNVHDSIRLIGKEIRNPTMHPQEEYDFHKAHFALVSCGRAIKRMATVLASQNKTLLDGWELASKTMQTEF